MTKTTINAVDKFEKAIKDALAQYYHRAHSEATKRAIRAARAQKVTNRGRFAL